MANLGQQILSWHYKNTSRVLFLGTCIHNLFHYYSYFRFRDRLLREKRENQLEKKIEGRSEGIHPEFKTLQDLYSLFLNSKLMICGFYIYILVLFNYE
jgi:hypothetical protein